MCVCEKERAVLHVCTHSHAHRSTKKASDPVGCMPSSLDVENQTLVLSNSIKYS